MKGNKFITVCLLLVIGLMTLAHPKAAVKVIRRITGHGSFVRYNAVAPVAAQNGVAIFTASSLDRVFQDGKTLLRPDFRSTITISLAKNEYRSFQLVIQSQNRPLADVTLTVSDLESQAGHTIDKNNISSRIVGFVKTQKPYYPVRYVGLWPDPLLPAHPIDIKTHSTQPFWITVYVPSGAKAGDYKGSISVMIDSRLIQTIAFGVHVYDFLLPQTGHFKTAFDFYNHLTKIRYPQAPQEDDEVYRARVHSLNDQFIIMMLQYRMDPVLNLDPSSQEELSSVDRYLVGGLHNFSIGKRGGTFNNNWPKDEKSIEALFPLYREYGEDLKLNDMLQYAYIYVWDEGDMGNPQVAKVASMIHRAYPGLRTMVCYQGLWDAAQGAGWIKDIDIWTFQIDHFDETKMRQLMAMGKEIWMYASGPSGGDTPNLVIDADSIDYRIIPWLCWKYDIQGFLYWCVNWWPSVDPFVSAKNSEWEQNGNGLLFYPGKDGPVASIRDELFREGMEDYEYIQLLFGGLKILKNKNLDTKYQKYFDESIQLLTIDPSIAASMSRFTKDGKLLDARRNAIAQKIEGFQGKLP